jgi:hypothetical protein
VDRENRDAETNGEEEDPFSRLNAFVEISRVSKRSHEPINDER